MGGETPNDQTRDDMWMSALVIMTWPERIKTQPHDDGDNCFQHFDSKGPLRYDSEQ